jgi:hypothetical protein
MKREYIPEFLGQGLCRLRRGLRRHWNVALPALGMPAFTGWARGGIAARGRAVTAAIPGAGLRGTGAEFMRALLSYALRCNFRHVP